MPKKTYAGVKNDKERTKRKLIDAVGAIIRRDGFRGLKFNAIAREAQVDKKLITAYFGSTEVLVETYIRGKDYWTMPGGNANELANAGEKSDTRDLLETLLINHLDYFSQEEEMQKIILWQISERSRIMFEVAEDREKLGADFFRLADPNFEKTTVDIRAITALLVGGIYYTVLHAKSNDSLFCQIDLNTEDGLNRIKSAVSEILTSAYNQAALQKSD